MNNPNIVKENVKLRFPFGKTYTGNIVADKYYYTGDIALSFVDSATGELITVLTVALESPASPGSVFIKDYSENEGLLDQLIEQEIVGEPTNYVRSGYVTIPMVPLLIEVTEW